MKKEEKKRRKVDEKRSGTEMKGSEYGRSKKEKRFRYERRTISGKKDEKRGGVGRRNMHEGKKMSERKVRSGG